MLGLKEKKKRQQLRAYNWLRVHQSFARVRDVIAIVLSTKCKITLFGSIIKIVHIFLGLQLGALSKGRIFLHNKSSRILNK